MLRRLLSRVRHLLGGRRFRRELDDEMAFHLEALAADLERQGMSHREARRQARIRFGNTERVHERARQERGLALSDETARNLRVALRGLVRNPLFSSTFVLTLALCIGLGTAVFTVVDAVLWRPLPFPAPERLAHAVLYDPALGKNPGNVAVDGRTWERIRDEGEPFERAVYSAWARGVNLSTDHAAAFVHEQRVGAGYFRTLGIRPALGREFEPYEDVPDGPAVAVLSHQLWTETFGADPEILGQTIRLKGEAHTVVGVLSGEFRSPADADVWTPLRASTTGEGGGTNYAALVRLPEGMSFQEADARLAGIEPPRRNDRAPDVHFGLVAMAESLSIGLRLPMLMLLGGAGLMLLVGCANLAGLQIARSLARRQELATRQALGGGTATLVRQRVVENVLLGALGGALGWVLATVTLSATEGLVQSHFGLWQQLQLDGRALVAALAITAFATLLFGLASIVQVANTPVGRLLVSGSRAIGGSAHRVRKALLVGQVALVTALLFGSGLLVRSYGYLEGLDPGFEPDGVLTVQLSLDDARYGEAEAVTTLFRESLEEMGRIPGVRSAAVTLTLPYERALNLPFRLPTDEQSRIANAVYVTPGFFETMRIPLVRGRAFGDQNRASGSPVIVVNQAFVDANLPDQPPLGATVTMGFWSGGSAAIVGVVRNVQQSAGWGRTSRPVWETPTIYLPAYQATGDFFRQIHVWFAPSWVIRGAGSGAELAARVTRAFGQVAPDLPTARVATLTDVMDRAFARQRFEAAFLMGVAAFALLLAGIGLYGIVAHEVLERRTEIGLRMALGSTPTHAVWTVGAGGMRLTALGLAVGAVAAVGVARVLQHLIWGVTPYDPVTMAALVTVLTLLGLTASFVPASRLGRMNPGRVLREG